MAVLGILFDIDALGSSQYGMAAYRILFNHLNQLQLRGARFRDGDTRATLSRRENVYCIAIESVDPAVIAHVAERLGSATDCGLFPPEKRLLRDPAVIRSEPLVSSGAVNDQGEFIVENDSLWVARVWEEARNAAQSRRKGETAGTTKEGTEERGRKFVNNARFGHVETLVALLDEGVDINFREDGHSTALMAASGSGRLATVEFLVARGASLNLQDGGLKTAPMRAAFQGKEDVCKFLIERGANLEMQDDQGGTALFLATLTGRVGVARLLINKGAKVDHQIKNGTTALMLAAERGFVEIIGLLLDNRANANLRASDGCTALDIAIQSDGPDGAAAALLRKHTAVGQS